jgi:hypothetical protein
MDVEAGSLTVTASLGRCRIADDVLHSWTEVVGQTWATR